MEKAIIVAVDLARGGKEDAKREAQEEALAELNSLLADGWSVKTSAAMGGTDGFRSACIVILHKD